MKKVWVCYRRITSPFNTVEQGQMKKVFLETGDFIASPVRRKDTVIMDSEKKCFLWDSVESVADSYWTTSLTLSRFWIGDHLLVTFESITGFKQCIELWEVEAE